MVVIPDVFKTPDKREVGSSTLPRPICPRFAGTNREERGRKEKGDEKPQRPRWQVSATGPRSSVSFLLSPFCSMTRG